MRNLSRGDRGKEVLDVQTRLRGQGFVLGSEGADGFFGPNTAYAVRAFQQRRGMLVDGIVGANTWRELVEAGYSLGDRLLYLKEPPFRGDDVLALQVELNLLGFNTGAERGVHDEVVERAVLDFQHNAGLMGDGIVGEGTLAKFVALRKAESGREGKKIPERDRGYVQARTLTGQAIVIDPGHGGRDAGVTSPAGVTEKGYTLAVGRRRVASASRWRRRWPGVVAALETHQVGFADLSCQGAVARATSGRSVTTGAAVRRRASSGRRSRC